SRAAASRAWPSVEKCAPSSTKKGGEMAWKRKALPSLSTTPAGLPKPSTTKGSVMADLLDEVDVDPTLRQRWRLSNPPGDGAKTARAAHIWRAKSFSVLVH